jgi:hypothetical protein
MTNSEPQPSQTRRRRSSAFRRRPASPFRFANTAPQINPQAWRFLTEAMNGWEQTAQTFGIVFARGGRGLVR